MANTEIDQDPVEQALSEYIETPTEGRPRFDDVPESSRERLSESISVIDGLREISELLAGSDRPEPRDASKREEVEGSPRTILDRYEVIRTLGSGGTSTVVLASDPELDRLVAIKELRAPSQITAARTSWIQTEARSLARIRAEAVLKVHDVSESDGVPILITEYVKGPSLREVIQQMRGTGPEHRQGDPTSRVASVRADALIDTSARVRLVARLARGLQACHRERVLHRDIKPENVLLRRSDGPVLIDFGLAHLADDDQGSRVTQVLMGTPLYLAPEQVDEAKTGARPETDIWALGMVLHELLTLRHPFEGLPRERVLQAISVADIPSVRATNRRLSKDVETVVSRALQRDPGERYPSMSAFADDLEALASGAPISASPMPISRTLERWLTRHRRGLLSVAAVAAGCLVAAAGNEYRLTGRVRGLETRVNSMAADVADFSAPGQFEEALNRLSDLRLESQSLANALQFPWRDSGRADVGPLTSALSDHLRAAIRKEALELDTEAHPWVRRKDAAKLNLRWSRLIEQAQSAGASTGLRSDRVSVQLSAGTRMFRMGDDNGPSLTEWLNPSSTPPGRYRLVRTRMGKREVMEVELIENQLAAEPTFGVMPSELSQSFIRVHRQDGTAFWITPRPITNAEFEAAFDPVDIREQNELRSALLDDHPNMAPRGKDGDPANVASSRARAYAARIGCRLPSVEEIFLAEEWLVDLGGEIQTTLSVGDEDASWSYDTPSTRPSSYIPTLDSPPLEYVPVDAIPLGARLHLVRESQP